MLRMSLLVGRLEQQYSSKSQLHPLRKPAPVKCSAFRNLVPVSCRAKGNSCRPQNSFKQGSDQPSRPGLLSSAQTVATAAGGLSVLCLLLPAASHAASGVSVPIETIQTWLDKVEALGPLGPIVFVIAVCSAEMVPLFPTQPLTLASGLLFGGVKGALYMLMGTFGAALLAFSLSRGLGRKFIESRALAEFNEAGANRSFVQSKLALVEKAIAEGGFWRQTTAVALLRLTPVVPFSVTNYLLGFTPLPVSAFLLGSTVGMGFWSVVYASLGGASRVLVRNGGDLTVLLDEMTGKAGEYTSDAAKVALALGICTAFFLVGKSLFEQQQTNNGT